MDRKLFTLLASEALRNERCELFVGSGVSCSANLPNWKELLRPVAESYGFSVDRFEDLPAIAQYIVNENSGNRNILTQLICNNLSVIPEPTSLHRVIANMGFQRIWTTNYDSLLENTLCKCNNVLLIKKDADYKQTTRKGDVCVIKMHGSSDELESIVLTSSDYETFFASHPLISEQFAAALINRSFLFIGYSYSDPDIRTIMAEAQSKLDGTQNHFLIAMSPQRNDGEQTEENYMYRLHMFNAWIKELRRIGIHVLAIDHYEQLQDILSEISRKARGKSVFITGSHDTEGCIAHLDSIVSTLLSYEATLINGQSAGVGLAYLNAFCRKVVENKCDLESRIRFFSNPYSINSHFSNDKALLPELKRIRYNLFKSTQLMIFYPGGMGTMAELELAFEQQCSIIPIISDENAYDNEAIMFFLNSKEAMFHLTSLCPQYADLLSKRAIPKEEDVLLAIKCCLEE